MTEFVPFDRRARQRARDRAARLIGGRDQLLRHIEEELEARLALLGPLPEGPELRVGLLVPPPPGAVGLDPSPVLAARHGGLAGEEDARHFADEEFARIVALMTLHGVNDLPGALVLLRRALKKGGWFQAAFPGGFSLGSVREAFLIADSESDRGVPPRVGPTVDPREISSLLQRAGFADPVAEVVDMELRYRSLRDFALDARAHGDTGWLAARHQGLTTPARWAAAEKAFLKHRGEDGRTPVQVQILYLSGTSR